MVGEADTRDASPFNEFAEGLHEKRKIGIKTGKK